MSWKSDPKLWPAHTPFFRRFFVNEREREIQETLALYERVRQDWPDQPISEGIVEELVEVIGRAIDQPLPEALWQALVVWVREMVACDPVLTPMPVLPEVVSLKELAELRSNLFARQHYLANRDRYEEDIKNTIFCIATGLAEELPELVDGEALFQVPLGSFFPDHNAVLARILGTFLSSDAETGLHHVLRAQFYLNVCRIAKIDPEAEHKKPLPSPEDTKLPFDEALTYVANTPFDALLRTAIPLPIPDETFFSHMHVIGGSGAGKTQWLSTLIRHHLKSPARPSLVVVDSQGDLIRSLSHLGMFARDDRLILITPKEVEYPPSINIFDVNAARIAQYDRVTREQVVAGAIQTLDYLFSGILGADLTAKQGVFFRFLARLLLKVPDVMGRNATLLDMLELTDRLDPYMDVVAALEPVQRRFFERDFNDKGFRQTKEQLRYRLNGILENPTLERLFTSAATKVDLFKELNRGAVILIDTAKDFLKDNSANYGRIFIALVLQAIMERAALPEYKRRPTYLIVDEAHEYFDQNIDDLLTQVRKYKLGCVFAHQYLGQCSVQLRASLAANTAIKLASGVSVNDARALAPDMRTTADFILSQPKLQFAAYVRGVTPQAVSLPVVPGLLAREPQMSERQYEAFRERNRARVSERMRSPLPETSASVRSPAREALPPAVRPQRDQPEDPTLPGEW